MTLQRLLAGYVAGLILAAYLPEVPFVAPLAGFAVSGLLGLLLPASRLRALALIIALFCAGNAQYILHLAPPTDERQIERWTTGELLVLEGVVLRHDRRPDAAATLLVDTTAIGITAPLQPVSGRIRLAIERDSTPLMTGDRIRLQTALRKPSRFNTPGEFDTPRHLARQGVFATGFVLDSRDIARFRQPALPLPTDILLRFRQQVSRHIDSQFEPQTAALLSALATGDRGGMSASQRALLARSGLAHLFAISGLHLGLVAGILYFAARALYRRSSRLLHLSPPQRLLPLMLLPTLAGYLVFTGSALSTWRAFLLLVLAAAAGLARRRYVGTQPLVAVAALVLLCDPLALFDASFQLSFAGAAGIVVIWPRWQPIRQRLPRLLAPPLTIAVCSAAASLATLPFALLHFHLFAPAGLLLNIVAIPIVSLIAVPAVLAAIAVLPWWPAAATVLMSTAAFCLEQLLALARWTLSLSTLDATVHYLPPATIVLIGVISWSLLATRWNGRRTIVIGVATGLLMLPPLPRLRPNDALVVTALSVGQGDAILLQTPGGKNYLIDGGGLYGADFDTGERLVAPALGWLGVRRLDAVLLSHPHPDHASGLTYIVEQFPVTAFWSSVARAQIPPELDQALALADIPMHLPPSGWSAIDPEHTLWLFVAKDAPAGNDSSLVVYAEHGHDGVLLTGDLERQGIARLTDVEAPGPVTLLKIPHHGSRTSLPEPLIARFDPQLAFVSVGSNNRYNQPHTETLAAIGKTGMDLRRTDQEGTLRFSTCGDGWTTQHWNSGLFH